MQTGILKSSGGIYSPKSFTKKYIDGTFGLSGIKGSGTASTAQDGDQLIVTSDGIDYTVDIVTPAPTAGSCVVFDATSNQKVDMGEQSDLNFSTAFSVTGWVWLSSTNADAGVFGKCKGGGDYNGYWIWRNEENNIRFCVNGTSDRGMNCDITSLKDQWVFIAITWSGTTYEMLVNNVSKGTYVSSTPPDSDASGASFKVGNYGDSTALKGKVDELVIWNKCLTPTELTALWNSGTGVFTEPSADTLRVFHFDENTGVTAYDSVAGTYNGTLTNSPTWGTGYIVSGDGICTWVSITADIKTMTDANPTIFNAPDDSQGNVFFTLIDTSKAITIKSDDTGLFDSTLGGASTYYIYLPSEWDKTKKPIVSMMVKDVSGNTIFNTGTLTIGESSTYWNFKCDYDSTLGKIIFTVSNNFSNFTTDYDCYVLVQQNKEV